MRKDRVVPVRISISKLVPVTSNDGGYIGRECLMCGKLGFVRNSDYGYHHSTPLDANHMSNDLTHKRTCVLNKYIDKKTGELVS